MHQEDGLDRNLGSWVVKQRMDRKSLTSDQRSRLENLPGWAWDTRDFRFEQNFVALQKFVDREGHASPNTRWKEGEVHLGKWVMNLRRSRTKLSEDRISRLEGLLGWQWVAKK